MKINQNLISEFSIEELESRFEMKTWIKTPIGEDPDPIN